MRRIDARMTGISKIVCKSECLAVVYGYSKATFVPGRNPMSRKTRPHKRSGTKKSATVPRWRSILSKFDRRTKVVSCVLLAFVIAGVAYARWLPTEPPRLTIDETSGAPKNVASSSVKNVSTLSESELANIPPEALHPQPPATAGYNASQGGLPPGALPPGVVLPGINQPLAPPPQGYGVNDGVRQQFTSKERDNETGLDYFGARYYSSAQGRFTSVDLENAGADPSDPQSWNAYAYARNNPLKFTDPDGRKIRICDNEGRCSEISDADADKYTFNREYARTHGFAVSGNKIFDSQGNQVGTWVRTSFDNLNDFANGVIFGSGNTAGLHQRLAPVQKVARVELHIIAAFSVPIMEAGPIATLSIEATEEATTAATPAAVEAAPQAASALKNAITGFTKHGINSAISHDGVGVSSRAILNTLRNPIKVVPQSGGRIKVVGQEAIVILNRAGKVITTWAKSGAATRVK